MAAPQMTGAIPEMAVAAASCRPDPERIAARAYELYLARGGADGYADQDWLTAERELSNGNRPITES